ncbi:hypothetical protein [Methylibium petroleiphilum]|uniref:Uncharacterized protein n=1 Tax=Methylibium petroleiphilum (strain ATCC BAA-1232 / LMG 22953 / PM1) TaxID=420662 RepID=A2SPB8_METPP|nr:hypothetical protein [Methylibium petroleiphilum]ABM97407.1 hypothetical protein Mpe_B0643 [Methylibium petroleiphilum PM1]
MPVARAILKGNVKMAVAFIELGCSTDIAPAPEHPHRGDLAAFVRTLDLPLDVEAEMVAELTSAQMRRRIQLETSAAVPSALPPSSPARRVRAL